MCMTASHSDDARLDRADDRQPLGDLLGALADPLPEAWHLDHGGLTVDEDAGRRSPADRHAWLRLRPRNRERTTRNGEDVRGGDRRRSAHEDADVAGHR